MPTTVSPAAARDYTAVVINGMTPSAHAKAINVEPASVTANVSRAKRALAEGAALPDGTTGDAAGPSMTRPDTLDAWMRANDHDDDNAVLLTQMFVDSTSDKRDAVSRIDGRIMQLVAERDKEQGEIDKRANMVGEAVGFDIGEALDAYHAYVDAFTPTPIVADATPIEPDATPDPA